MKIDVWYDVVCPWCWLGKARLDHVVAGESGVEVVSHSFELDAQTPKDLDESTTERIAKKYGMSRTQIDALHERISSMGREVGIEYRFEGVRTSNTFDAHQLVHHARVEGGNAKANETVERLFRANFHEGLRVGARDVLVRLASDVGLAEAGTAEALEAQSYANAVREDEALARRLGVSGVPFFVFGDKVRVSGAQSVEVLRAALERSR